MMDRGPMMNCSAGVLIRQPPGLWEDPPDASAPRTHPSVSLERRFAFPPVFCTLFVILYIEAPLP
jgi:hypothetical protein